MSPHSDLLQRARAVGLLTDDAPTDFPHDPAACAAALVSARLLTEFQAAALLAGSPRLRLGPYLLLRPLGEGGMGRVYLARHTDLGRRVAVKVLNEAAADPLAVERFRREARAAAALDHPNIVHLYDIGRDGDTEYLVMEAVDGTDLQRLLADGPLQPAAAAEYIRQAAIGLGQAHARGIIHRDIKPANLMLADGVVKVLDLGLARSLSDPADAITNPDKDGSISGTVDYLSPEQATGGPLDRRADIYALGATLAALVTGQPPYSGTVAQKLLQHQLAPPPDLHRATNGRVPAGLADVIRRMMAKAPADRPATADEVARLLAPWADAGRADTPLPTVRTFALSDADAPTVRLAEPVAPPARRWKPLLLAATITFAASAVVVAAWAAGLFARSVAEPEPRSPAPLYRLDLSGAAPFDETATTADKPDNELPPPLSGWHRNVWRPGCTARYRVATVDGHPAIGFSADRDGSQLAFRLLAKTFLALPRAHGLRVTVEMKVEGSTFGYCTAKAMTADRVLEAVAIPAGEWVRRTFDVPNPRDDFELAFGSAFPVWVRRVEVAAVPFAAPPGDVIYSTRFREMGEFRRLAGAGADGFMTQPAVRPPGWVFGCDAASNHGEFSAVADEFETVLSVAAGTAPCSQWAFLPKQLVECPLTPNGRYRARVEYRSEIPTDFIAGEMDSWHQMAATELRPSARWAMGSVSFTAPPVRSMQLQFRPKIAGKPFEFRRFWIERLPPVPADAKPVYELDVSAFAGLVYRFDDRVPIATPLPAGWWMESYQAGDVSELTGGEDDRRPHLALRNKIGRSAQLYRTQPGPVLATGTAYRMMIEYRATADTLASIDLREKDTLHWQDVPFRRMLPHTDGKWETRHYEITPPRDWPLVPVLQNLGDGGSNEFAVRRFTITPVPER